MNGSMPLKSTQGFFGNSSAFPRTGKLTYAYTGSNS